MYLYVISNYVWYLIIFVALFLSIIIFKEVNLVNRGVWVDKNLASQRSHEEASWGSLLMKLLKEATWSCLGKNAAQPPLTVGSSRNLVCSFTRHFSLIWPSGSSRRYLECARRFRVRDHFSLERFQPLLSCSLGKTPFLLLSFFQSHS